MSAPTSAPCPALERQALVHPVVVFEDLFAAESGHAFGAGLGDLDQLLGADRFPELSDAVGVADEQVVFGTAERPT